MDGPKGQHYGQHFISGTKLLCWFPYKKISEQKRAKMNWKFSDLRSCRVKQSKNLDFCKLSTILRSARLTGMVTVVGSKMYIYLFSSDIL